MVRTLLCLALIALEAHVAYAVCTGGTPDGAIAPGEECDDNNQTPNDGCSASCTIEGEFSCARAISFANLSVQDFTGATASWTISGGNTTGVQSVNTARPSVALFGQNAQFGTYVVRMTVQTTADDDFIGFALGFDPGDQSSNTADYLVVDWKQLAQGGVPNNVPVGLRVAHVRGVPFAADHMDHGIPQRRCDNATTSCVRQLATGIQFGATGWADNTAYTALVTYRPDRLEIVIDGRLELALAPGDFPGEFAGNVFPGGQMGFYTHSQEQVQLVNLAPFGPSVCNLTSLNGATLTRPLGTPSVSISTAGQLVDVGDALAPPSVSVRSVTGAATATVSANGDIVVTPANPNIAATYTVTVFACDNDPIVPDCDTATFTITYTPDRDGDGVGDAVDLDDDDDGIPDRRENLFGIDPDADADGDGVPNIRDRNNRGDGMPQVCTDANTDNICDTLGRDFDRDADGVANHLDLDADNDGILDVVEVFPGQPDVDRNGRYDCPGGVGANGLCNAVETTADSGVIDWSDDGVGPDTATNTDGDGLPDFLDLDSDGDGVRDLDEGNSGCADSAPSDGRCDGADTDGDGVVNSRDTVTGLGVGTYPVPPDTDGDGTPDYRDLDADGDGIRDLVEANAGCVDTVAPPGVCDGADANADGIADDAAATRPDTDGDGRPDYRDLDADNDGIRDAVEGTRDSDGDGRPDFRDLDSDNDGIPDVVEGRTGCGDTAPRDGRCDGGDANGDGLPDASTVTNPGDTDGDGAPDYRDLDTDNDGISDVTEGGSACADAAPANAVCDGPDGNGDGLVDSAQLVTAPDSDGDGVADYRDLDSDDDGLSDLAEGGSACTDADANAVCDGPDGDGDGIASSIDGAATFGDPSPTVPTNTDGTDQPDYRDPDRDNDGIPDTVASGCVDAAPANQRCDGPDSDGDGFVDQGDGFTGHGIKPDRDGDGVVDALDLDDDNDGIPDSVEQGKDTDDDGVTDDRDLDSDNDGLPDVAEAGHTGKDEDGDGKVDCPGGFGANGLCDALETTADSGIAVTAPIDTDGDTVPDFRDLDSDDDGIGDRAENGTACADQPVDGVCDGDDPDRDGSPSTADMTAGFGIGGYPPPPDTDGDGLPDYRDRDADGDGIFDTDEAGHGDLDTDNDGTVDGEDADGDGIVDGVDGKPTFGGAGTVLDTDGDGTPDQQDLDSDGDGVSDHDEAGNDSTNPDDSDGDGMPDFQDVDSDNDGVSDGADNCRVERNDGQADIDGDGIGDSCDGDGLGIKGGGCQIGDTGSAGSTIILLLALVLARRRRSGSIMLVVLGILAFAPIARAQLATDYPAERFSLAAHRDGILGVPWADVRGHLVVDGAIWLGYANDPINVYRTSDGTRVASLVADRLGGELVIALQLFDRVELDLGIPLVVSQSAELGSFMDPNSGLSGFGLGDLRVTPKLTLARGGAVPVAAALQVEVTLPTTSSEAYGGDTGATASPALVISRGGSRGFRTALAAGYRARASTRALDLMIDDEVFARVGAGYRFSRYELDGTFDVATDADDMLGAFNRNHAEARAGIAVDVVSSLRVFGAGGLGLAEGYGTPDWRMLVGVRLGGQERARPDVRPVVIDTDRDGISDALDRCPGAAETINVFEDDDGCPDDPDPDHDGVAGVADRCPDAAEDVDAFQDADGCPDPDNDGDTVLDATDRCRDVAGLVAMQGCPDPDRDGDGVVDRLDNCPDEAGTAEHQGCAQKQLVRIGDGKLEILDIVYFALNKALIQPRSFPLLDDVARVLAAHPEIVRVRVEGHTDSKGNDAYNKKLSQRRADAVMSYLITKGIAAARLEAQGFGEDVPKADNGSADGRATNRRVEFTIIGGVGVTVQPTGPGEDTKEK
jgi:large repetitive protein